MNDQKIKVPVCRIYPDQIVLYNIYEGNFNRSERQIKTEENLTRGQYNGFMSPKTKSKVKKYLSTWINSVEKIKESKHYPSLDKKPNLTFVTLTLPSEQYHDDNEIKRKCLTPYIETLKRKYNVWEYFWRAEAQKNGNIHFHLIIDSYIHYLDIRNEWNKCVEKLGYIDSFFLRHGHRDPNSTDIHSLRKVRNIEAYVIKYCCKSDGYRKIDGRIHGCSDELRKLMPYECLVDSEINDLVNKAIGEVGTKVFGDDNYTVVLCDTVSLMNKYSPKTAKSLNVNYITIALGLYTKKTEPPPQQHTGIIRELINKPKKLEQLKLELC